MKVNIISVIINLLCETKTLFRMLELPSIWKLDPKDIEVFRVEKGETLARPGDTVNFTIISCYFYRVVQLDYFPFFRPLTFFYETDEYLHIL